MEAIAYRDLAITDESTSRIVYEEATTKYLSQRRTDDEVGEEAALDRSTVEAKTYTEIRGNSAVEERGQVVDKIGVDTEAELVTEQTYIGIWDEVEVGVAKLEVSTSTYIDLGLVTEVGTSEESEAVEEEDIFSLLYLDLFSIDTTIVLAVYHEGGLQ